MNLFEFAKLARSNPEPSTTPELKPEYKALSMQQKRQREIETLTRQMYGTCQDNIKKAGELRSDILKGIQQGENSYTLLLQAIECISKMTGESLFYTQSKEDIKAIYGVGFQQHQPLEIEIREVEKRLQMLTRPELQNEPADSKGRINRAIRQHKERLQYLKELQTKEKQGMRAGA